MTPDFSLNGMVSLVTGGSSGIGRAMATALARYGARIVLAARRIENLKEAAAQIRSEGGCAEPLVADLVQLEHLNRIAADAIQIFGRVDIVVNAAGVNFRERPEAVTVETWHSTLDIHLGAPFFLSRALVSDMRPRGWGRIINIASLQSQRAFPNSLPYGTAKAGVVQMTRAMAEAWSPLGITCNAIAPGFVPTELTEPVFSDPEIAAEKAKCTAIGRNSEPSDLDGAIIFLASSASDYVTGQTLFVDGGFTAK